MAPGCAVWRLGPIAPTRKAIQVEAVKLTPGLCLTSGCSQHGDCHSGAGWSTAGHTDSSCTVTTPQTTSRADIGCRRVRRGAAGGARLPPANGAGSVVQCACASCLLQPLLVTFTTTTAASASHHVLPACTHCSAQQPAAETYQLTLRKPLGLVLAERKTAGGAPEVFVEEVIPGELHWSALDSYTIPGWPSCPSGSPLSPGHAQSMRMALLLPIPRPGGNAAKDGQVQVGDVLTKCSAVLLKAGKEGEYEREGYGQR